MPATRNRPVQPRIRDRTPDRIQAAAQAHHQAKWMTEYVYDIQTVRLDMNVAMAAMNVENANPAVTWERFLVTATAHHPKNPPATAAVHKLSNRKHRRRNPPMFVL